MIIFKTKEINEDKNLKFSSGTKYVEIKHMPDSFVSNDTLEDYDSVFIVPESKRTLVLFLHMEMFHFFFDGLNTIIKEHKKNKDTLFVCIVKNSEDFKNQSYSRFFKDFVEHHKIKINIVGAAKVKNIKVTDAFYYTRKGLHPDEDISNDIFNYFIPFIKNKDINPFRKIYLSRSKVKDHTTDMVFGGKDPDSFLFKNDKRVDDEEELELFLKNNGYEIVNPESIKNFIDQVNLMYETKELISLTGSGLLNMIFMQRNQKVVELSTPLIVHGETSLHPFYYEIAYTSRHTYTSIPHDRSINQVKKALSKHWGGEQTE
jgi:hypothetical protein